MRKRNFLKDLALLTIAALLFSSCGDEKYDKELHMSPMTDFAKGDNPSGSIAVGLTCYGEGKTCRTVSNYASATQISTEFAIFKSYYDSNNIVAYFSDDAKYHSLFPQFDSYMSDIRTGIISGTYKVGLSNTNVVAVYIDNPNSLGNIKCAFQF